MTERVLVTGGSGYFGSLLVDRLHVDLQSLRHGLGKRNSARLARAVDVGLLDRSHFGDGFELRFRLMARAEDAELADRGIGQAADRDGGNRSRVAAAARCCCHQRRLTPNRLSASRPRGYRHAAPGAIAQSVRAHP